MSDGYLRNLSVFSPSMGQIVVQPHVIDKDEIQNAALVIYPRRVSKADIVAVTEWASGTQTPIFCNSLDIKEFEVEGFGAYRFHRLDSYREVDFQKGSIEFFPARRWRRRGWRAQVEQALEYFGYLKVPAFHVLIRPKNEHPVLFLSSPQLDPAQWAVFSRFNPSTIVGSEDVPEKEWAALSKVLNTQIVPAAKIGSVKTVALRPRADETLAEDTIEWITNIGA